MQNFYPSEDVFFATEAAAQAAAESTVQELYRRAGEQRSVAAGIASTVVIATGVAAIAAWKSPMGRKVRDKIANAIKAE